MSSARSVLLVVVLAVAAVVQVWGIRHDLPFTPEVDEPDIVTRAAAIATTGNPNPGWFGHPGSTVIYPLAAVYHVWNALARGGPWLGADQSLKQAFQDDPSQFVLLGRWLTIGFAVASLVLVERVGRRAFDPTVGIIGAWLVALSTLVTRHAQMVRTDSASLFWCMATVAACLAVLDGPTTRRRLVAAVAVGLAIATKYSLASLFLLLLATEWIVRRDARRAAVAGVIDLAIVLATFALATPYAVLHPRTALGNIELEGRPVHLGADGLTIAGNLWWYVSQAAPEALTWPVAVLAVLGAAFAIGSRRAAPTLLVALVVGFVGELSLVPLHWERWLIPIVPVFALLAAFAVVEIVRRAPDSRFQRWALAAMVLLVSIVPARALAGYAVRRSQPSTRVLAREWLVANATPKPRIAQEWYAAPLSPHDFTGYGRDRFAPVPVDGRLFLVLDRKSLATGWTLDEYRKRGFKYLIASSAVYGRYLAEPARYPAEVLFYLKLFTQATLVQEFAPSPTRDGPTIRIYQVVA